MNRELLERHLQRYKKKLAEQDPPFQEHRLERKERAAYYQSWTADRIRAMSSEDLYQYMSKLWALLVWRNKKYAIDRLVEENGFIKLKNELADLIWGTQPVSARWDRFRQQIKGMGQAMISELLCNTHPEQCALWNRRAHVGLNYLEVSDLPRHDHQLSGEKYAAISRAVAEIASEMRRVGIQNADLLLADSFISHELQVEGA